MGAGQTITIAVLVVACLFVVVLLVRPEIASRIPGLDDLVYYRADFNVYIEQERPFGPTDYIIDVRDITYRKATLSIGGFGFFSTAGKLEVTVYKGDVHSNFQDAIVVDKVDVDWEWGMFSNSTTVPVSVKLGAAGSGKYTLKFQCREYDEWQQITSPSRNIAWPYPFYMLVVLEVPTQ